jgi:cytochrome c oxidase subunit II
MSRSLHLALLVPLVLIPACGKRAEQPPAVVIDPSGSMSVEDGKAPPPRLVPPAAEPGDPKDAMEVFVVVGANGALKVQYPQGQRVVVGDGKDATETERSAFGSLVLPLNAPVKLICSAEKGATAVEIPAFPLAVEAKAGGYSSATVKPTRTGEFGIWSGRDRAGRVVVVPVAEFDAWLAGVGPLRGENPVDGSPAAQGRQLFLKLQCINCHSATPNAKGPTLEGLYGAKVKLTDVAATIADEQYIAESVRHPKAKVVDGWGPIMPAYDATKVNEEELNALVAYIKSLERGDTKPKEERFPAPVGAPK